MEQQALHTQHQAPYIPDTCFGYAADTWTLLSADVRTLGAFHQKCLRQLLRIRWYDRVRHDEVLQGTGLTLLSHLLSCRRISVFGLVARLDTSANMALPLHIHRPPDRTWRRPPRRIHGTSGSTSYETIPSVRLEISGGVLSAVDMVVQRRDGLRQLLDDDDDDSDDDDRLRLIALTTRPLRPVCVRGSVFLWRRSTL